MHVDLAGNPAEGLGYKDRDDLYNGKQCFISSFISWCMDSGNSDLARWSPKPASTYLIRSDDQETQVSWFGKHGNSV